MANLVTGKTVVEDSYTGSAVGTLTNINDGNYSTSYERGQGGVGLTVGATTIHIDFASSAVTQVKLVYACSNVNLSNVTAQVHIYYGSTWNQIWSDTTPRTTSTTVNIDGTWTGVTSVKVVLSSSTFNPIESWAASRIYEVEVTGSSNRAQAPLPQWYRPA